jgi:hypothetical protein
MMLRGGSGTKEDALQQQQQQKLRQQLYAAAKGLSAEQVSLCYRLIAIFIPIKSPVFNNH